MRNYIQKYNNNKYNKLRDWKGDYGIGKPSQYSQHCCLESHKQSTHMKCFMGTYNYIETIEEILSKVYDEGQDVV